MAKKPESDKESKKTEKTGQKSGSTGSRKAGSSRSTARKSPSRKSSAGAKAKSGSSSGKKAASGSASDTGSTSNDRKKAAAGPEEMPRTASEAVDQAVGRPISDKIWRLIAMVAFALIGYFAFIALVVLAAMQYIVVLVADKPNSELRKFMQRLTAYLKDIYDYLSYARDEMPFPFSAFPEDDS